MNIINVSIQNNKKNVIILNLILPLASIFIYGLSAGIRGNFGIFLNAISNYSKISYSNISFIIAFALIFFGIMQPLFGILALKKSNILVLFSGAIFLFLGLFFILFSKNFISLFISLGILVALGTAALSFGIVLSTTSSILGEDKTSFLSGIITSSSGIGGIILTPTLQKLIKTNGLPGAIIFLLIMTLCLFPIIFYFSNLIKEKNIINSNFKIKNKTGNNIGNNIRSNNTLQFKNEKSILNILFEKNFIILFITFLCCGFHLGIVEIHYYSQIISYNISSDIAAYIFLTYGISTAITSIIIGILCSKFKIKYILSTLYFLRIFTIILFFILPKSSTYLYIFSILLGICGAVLVSPTSTITSNLYGTKKLATLFGIIFLAHQIGSFISAWLGGVLYTNTNSYNLIWFISILISLFAGIICFFIKEPNYNNRFIKN